MNVDCGKHEQSLIQIAPGSQRYSLHNFILFTGFLSNVVSILISSRVVYDGRLLAQTIEDINSQTRTELEKWALVGQYASFFTGNRSSTAIY